MTLIGYLFSKLETKKDVASFITFAKIELENVRVRVSETLGVFVNTLTADDKYSLCNRKNLPQPIQLQLSKKNKFFLAFLLYI